MTPSPRLPLIVAGAAGLLIQAVLGCSSSLRSPSPTAIPVTPDPLVVSGVMPAEGIVELGPRFTVRITFGEPLDPSTLADSVLVTEASTGALVPGTERVEPGATPPRTTLVWQPQDGGMRPGERYSLALADTLRSETGGTVDVEASDVQFPLSYETFQTVPELTGVVAVLVTSCSSAEVSWSVTVTDNSPPEVISYRVLLVRAGSPFDPEEFALETAPGESRAFLEELEPSTAYEVAVVAVDAVGNSSSPADPVRFETPPVDRCDPIPPDFGGVTEVVVDPTRPQVIVVRWEAGEDNETAREDLRYAVYVALEAGAQDFSVPFRVSDPGAEEMAVTNLPTNTTHHVVVRSLDATGNEDSNRIELAATTPSSFSLDIRPILDQSPPFGAACTRPFCHSAPTNSGGLNLESYEALVIVGGSTRSPPVVDPGNSEQSYVLWRTDRSNPNFVRSRSQMPLGSPELTEDQLNAIRRWIDQGALDN